MSQLSAKMFGLSILAISGCAISVSYNTDLSQFPKWQRVVLNENIELNEPRTINEIISRWQQVPYVTDKSDYWQTRLETRRNGGDCEDFAIAIYYDLLESGVPEDKLLIVIVQVRKTKEIHAYLKYDDMVIDRRAGYSIITIKQADKLYLPLYGINRFGWIGFI